MTKAPASDAASTLVVTEIQQSQIVFNLVGTTPLMPHSASEHARAQLLNPYKKNAAEKASSMKHEPFDEYRDAAYQFSDVEATNTRLYLPASAIHAAMKSVAIDMIGAKKAQVGRLTSVPGVKLPLYGVPKINSMMVRSSDMARTPDIRTLPLLERWAIPKVTVKFVASLIKDRSIVNLLANAGIIIGLADGRPQHGFFDYGQFRLAQDDDPELLDIMKTGGIKAQDAALANPEYADLETEKMLVRFLHEKATRGAAPATTPKASKVPAAEVIAAKDKSNGNRRPSIR